MERQAAHLYENDLQKVLRRLAPFGHEPVIVKDRSPTSLKSSRAGSGKLAYKIVALPGWSPDLGPALTNRSPKHKKESVPEYKFRQHFTCVGPPGIGQHAQAHCGSLHGEGCLQNQCAQAFSNISIQTACKNGTDVHIVIQTVIQTVGKHGTDVQTVKI